MDRHLVPVILVLSCLATSCTPRAATAESCRSKPECPGQGKCGTSFHWTGDAVTRCWVNSEVDCIASRACKEEGRCHYEPHVSAEACVALRPLDCLNSSNCRNKGQCALAGKGLCIASEAGCKRGRACEEDGACQLSPPSPHPSPTPQSCVRTIVDDTQWCARACIEEGACQRSGRQCLADSDALCQRSLTCTREGRCVADSASGTCIARSDADCRSSGRCQSEVGKLERPCTYRPPAAFCVDGRTFCERSPRCRLEGFCEADEGVCRGFTEERCANSITCRGQGRCGLAPSGAGCFARDEGDCLASAECAAFGRCSLEMGPPYRRAGVCVNRSEPSGSYDSSYCINERMCLEEGRCLRRPDRTCVHWTEFETGDAGSIFEASESKPAQDSGISDRPLEGVLDGRRIRLGHAVAATRGGEAVQVALSDGPIGCEWVDGKAVRRDEGRTVVQLVLATPLVERVEAQQPPVGRVMVWRKPPSPRLIPTWMSWPGGVESGQFGAAESESGLGESGKTRLLRVAAEGRFEVSGERSTLALAGAVLVAGCGDFPGDGLLLPQPELLAQVDGQRLNIRSAVFKSNPDKPEEWTLELSSAPLACRRAPHADARVQLRPASIREGKMKRRLASVEVDGDRVGLTLAMQSIHWPLPKPTRMTGGLISFDLDFDFPAGELPLVPIRLRGKVHAHRCVEPP